MVQQIKSSNGDQTINLHVGKIFTPAWITIFIMLATSLVTIGAQWQIVSQNKDDIKIIKESKADKQSTEKMFEQIIKMLDKQEKKLDKVAEDSAYTKGVFENATKQKDDLR